MSENSPRRITVATFLALIQDVIDNNPRGCVSYTSSEATVAGVVRGSESYSGKVVYENAQAKTVGQISDGSDFSTDVSTIIAATALNTVKSGTPGYDSSGDSFSCTLKCHASNGENYSVTFRQDGITFSSYEADSIRTSLESWADTVAILA